MYNWSVDEEKFKNIEGIIKFLRKQPEIISVKRSNEKDKNDNIIIITKLVPNIHPVRKFFIAKYIEEKTDKLQVSVIEKNN